MYVAAFFALVFGALVGLFMALRHFQGKESGKAVGIMHGFWTVTGTALLAVGLAEVEASWGWWVLVGLLATAAGGAFLFYRQLKGEPWPGVVIVAHGALGIAAVVVLGLWIGGLRETGVEDQGMDADVPSQTIENEPVDV